MQCSRERGAQIHDALTPTGAVAFEPFINKPELARRLGKRARAT